MNYFEQRRYKKAVKHLLHEARHTRYMREDIANPADLERLDAAARAVKDAWEQRDIKALDRAADDLAEAIQRVAPPRSHRKLRENLDILVVAVSVAMAFRTFFIQPFKIPTGSMQPTLYGVTMQPPSHPAIFDKLPLSIIKFALFGDRPITLRAPASGVMEYLGESSAGELILGSRKGMLKIKKLEGSYPARVYRLGGGQFMLPIPDAFERMFQDGDRVSEGQVLARGNLCHGDHIFVDKIRYNFTRPKRGNIIVFDTHELTFPNVRTNTFYIKRCAGIPNDKLMLDPPYLVANGQRLTEPYPFYRLVNATNQGYRGYTLPSSRVSKRPVLATREDVLQLADDEYLPLGDNTRYSLDGRYFGPIKQRDLVGPAFMVYWPISKRWGHVR